MKPLAWALLSGALMAAALMVVPDGRAAIDDTAPPTALQTAVVALPQPAAAKPQPDLSGHRRVGVASFYADRFGGRQMANGEPMDLEGDNAASRTLPLGTTARVTNLETGRSAVITIQDRGPYVSGRLVDLSPGTARRIGLTKRKGLAKVVVAPLVVPLPDGRVKLGAAVQDLRMAQLDTGFQTR